MKDFFLVTGCDTGIGNSLTKKLLGEGYPVVFSYLNTNNFEGIKNAYGIQLDLRNTEQIQKFCIKAEDIINTSGKLRCIILNAGVALGGPVENIPMEIFHETFQINFFGNISVLKHFIPMLENTKGRIVFVGSLAGKIAMPFLSPYASSKFALEGFCDSLRRELNPFGVKTIMIEPAAVATPIWNKAKEQDISFADEKYMKSLFKFRDNFIEGGNYGMSSDPADEEIMKIKSKDSTKDRYKIAKDKLRSKIITHIPQSLIDKAVRKMFKMNYGGD